METIITNLLLTGGITLFCLLAFYFIQWTKGTSKYKILLLAWCVPAFLMLLTVNFAVQASLVYAIIAVAGGLAVGAGILIPVHLAHKKKMPQQEAPAAAEPQDYPHFVAGRLLSVGLHHVEFVTPEESTAFDMRAKDAYGQKVCVKCKFSPNPIDVEEIVALYDAQKAGGFARAVFFSNASFTPEARANARQLQVEIVERFRA